MTVGELLVQLHQGIDEGRFTTDAFLETEGCDCIGPASGIWVRAETGMHVVTVTRDDEIERPFRLGQATTDACVVPEPNQHAAPAPPPEHQTRTFPEPQPAKKE